MSVDLTAFLTQASGLVGALIGGGTSLAVAIYNHRAEERQQRVAAEVARRETVYTDFLEHASKILLKAYTHDGIALGGDEQHLIVLIDRMRLFAPPEVVAGAEAVVRALVEISLRPSVELRQLAMRALAENPEPDPFRQFSVTCRSDLDRIRRRAR
jgi:hypothetical protein